MYLGLEHFAAVEQALSYRSSNSMPRIIGIMHFGVLSVSLEKGAWLVKGGHFQQFYTSRDEGAFRINLANGSIELLGPKL